MSIVSSADHWLFIASTGGLTAGRGQVDRALFPYYTEDKLAENNENTDSKTILIVTRGARTFLWEPFSVRQDGIYRIERNLYKNIPGTALIFEEINHTLELTFRYAWRTGDQFGFIKTAWLSCHAATLPEIQVELLDGIQNILPANVSAMTQNRFSCLLDAYKRSETLPETGLGIFALNATLTDLAEPSESLRATTVFQIGLQPQHILLSSRQLDAFRSGSSLHNEREIRGQRGAYFVHALLNFASTAEHQWHIIAEVHQDHTAIAHLQQRIRTASAALLQAIEQDIDFNTFNLQKIVASADGLQISANLHGTAHHFANVLFNIMRGGIFANQYRIEKRDLLDFLATHQLGLQDAFAPDFAALPQEIPLPELHTLAARHPSADVRRLLFTYLPLTFSRRHGDPSRPWNNFAINLKQPNGAQRLDYEGNWRDIFQNWEALAYAYPEYVEPMLFTFLCATTLDGYNPYRITRAGVDWEIPEEGNSWANIGYWSDHQIIYLQKLLELSVRLHPGALHKFFEQPLFSYANVPYRIAPYAQLLADPSSTIDFDHHLHNAIEARIPVFGSDARLLCAPDGSVLHATLIEKLLTLLLAKLVNFVPEGGIWMNTHTQALPRQTLQNFFSLILNYIEHSLRANRRPDNLYHAYKVLHLEENRARIARLPEMLEGQVAILSSGLLTAEESLALLQSLRHSPLYRADQHTYILYPNKEQPGFLEKNNPPAEQVAALQLPNLLAQTGDVRLFVRDRTGAYHFSGDLHNLKDVRAALEALHTDPQYTALVDAESAAIEDLFETTFRHAEFTGRSGTFFGYEGLGSVYWHMVSKLLLAVQETALRFQNTSIAAGLRTAYADIRAGLGFNKTPAEYGAFPTDPYSHTPKHSGACQPGMTGMVKEEIITRYAEVGVVIQDGCIHFSPFLLDRAELLTAPQTLTYLDVSGEQQRIQIPANAFAYFLCQPPILVQPAAQPKIEIFYADETSATLTGSLLSAPLSRRIFQRDGWIKHLIVSIPFPE